MAPPVGTSLMGLFDFGTDAHSELMQTLIINHINELRALPPPTIQFDANPLVTYHQIDPALLDAIFTSIHEEH